MLVLELGLWIAAVGMVGVASMWAPLLLWWLICTLGWGD